MERDRSTSDDDDQPQKEAARKKPGTSISEVNTEKMKIQTHRKCVGTEDMRLVQEEPEVTILKEINIIRCDRKKQIQTKRTW